MKRVRLPVLSGAPPSGGCAGPCPPSCSCAPAPGPVITRRKFLAGAGAVAAGAIAGASGIASLARAAGSGSGHAGRTHSLSPVLAPSRLRTNYAPEANPAVAFAMALDLHKCIGCRKCAYACRAENNIGRDSGSLWIELHRMQRGSYELEESTVDYVEGGDPRYWYMPVACQQCENPPCVQACPVQATWREPDGIVLVDYRKCIGCRYCMVNCPYGARHFNWKRPVVPEKERNPKVPMRRTGVVEKCTFCVHRTRRGQLPACVEACPVGARIFGDLNDPKSPVSEILRTTTPVRLKEHLGTRPRFFYVG